MSEQTVSESVAASAKERPKTRKEIEEDGYKRVRRLSMRGNPGSQRHEDFSFLSKHFGLVEPEIRPLFFTKDAEVRAFLSQKFRKQPKSKPTNPATT
ncbi:hypothetical protein KW800_00730 [Candidatus Parcubacteria bacterium]|nr:hypothetical protein [Candidatus Parcubacteria bacterium]